MLTLFTIFFLCACKGQSSPYPSDQVLIDGLLAREADFLTLVSDPHNRELQSRLGVVSVREGQPDLFPVWTRDLFGPGGYAKGYYYCECTPEPLVDSIDEIYKNRPADEVRAYMHVKGPWYLYYAASN